MIIISSKLLTKSIGVVIVLLMSQIVFSAATETQADNKIKLHDFSGNPVQFENYISAKQWTVVMFWASDCHVCNVEASQFVKLHRLNQDKIRVLGVSVDGSNKKAQAQEFVDSHNLNFPNLIGEPDDIASLYNHYTQESWLGTPTFIIFSPSGIVKAQRPGMLPTELIVGFINSQSN